jgi:T3SS (YopN, CesT) and YbjN peptide-binding chaperone 2
MTLDRQLIEIASWHVVAELCRRHPTEFEVIEAHPSGGQSDCLALCRSGYGIHVAFNRPGSFAVFSPFESRGSGGGIPDFWSRTVSYDSDLKRLLNEVDGHIGLRSPVSLPATTRKVLTFRVMAAFMRATVFSLAEMDWRNGMLDTAGFGGGARDGWFDEYPQLRDRIAVHLATDPLDDPSRRFWFLIDQRWTAPSTLVCMETTGWVHFKDGTSSDLMKAYREGSRQLWPIVFEHLNEFIPG